ncbi:uncharacterized protein LOC110986041 [Acanthaster planci]|uniref:Uncharacterized protein LOC110986041 n=1 Tax=Acanthaster planci TaxID=133434 RepID=A0A8B7ZCB1_ACAPL|nr:uncharacterized protein LOC110986041 [Acanthaster planci]
MFRRSRVAPLQTKPPDLPAPAPSLGTRDGYGTRKRWSACPWTSRSQNASRTAESNRVPTRKPRVLRSNRIAPVGDQAAMSSRGLGMHKTAAVADLAELDQILQDTLPEKSPPKLLGRLASLWSCCTGKRGGSTLERSPASRPSRRETQDEEQPVGQTTEAMSRPTPDEKVGCCPLARRVTVAPATSPMFWVGSRDGSSQSNSSARDEIGQIQNTGRQGALKQQNHQNLTTVAHEQSNVIAEDIRKASLKLLSGTNSKPRSNEPLERSDDDDGEYAGAPSIDKRDLCFACKDRRSPKILGRGQSGVVGLMQYRKPTGSSSLVAVKRYLARSRSAMAKEIRALRAVDHCPIFPELVGIISEYSFAQKFLGDPKTFQTLSIAEALITGEPPISSENWAWVLCDVITGLSALHQSGWAHCDLQCNNVLLWRDWSQSDDSGERWHGRIIDLGNAQRLTGPLYYLTLSPMQQDALYRLSGHIAPEVVEGVMPYGVESDIYSMGVLMRDVARSSFEMFELILASYACTDATPAQRPTLEALLVEVDAWLRDHTGHGFLS